MPINILKVRGVNYGQRMGRVINLQTVPTDIAEIFCAISAVPKLEFCNSNLIRNSKYELPVKKWNQHADVYFHHVGNLIQNE